MLSNLPQRRGDRETRGNVLIVFAIKELQRHTEMRTRGRALLFLGLYFRVPQAPRCDQAERDNIPEETGSELHALGRCRYCCQDNNIKIIILKPESQERGEPIQPLRWIRQLLSQVPDQGNCWDFCWLAPGPRGASQGLVLVGWGWRPPPQTIPTARCGVRDGSWTLA